MGDGESFTFVMNPYPLFNYPAGSVRVELTNELIETVGVGTDWVVDTVNYRLKYVNSTPKIYQLSLRLQQLSSTGVGFRPVASIFQTFPFDNATTNNSFIIAGTVKNGTRDEYTVGVFMQVRQNTVLGFTIAHNQGANVAGTATDFTFTVFLNELR
jgi:hypothetical protein